LRSWTWSILKEIYDIIPEKLIVKVSVHSAPGSDAGKCESDLQNSASTSIKGEH
jgi:hypothetical protein